MQTGMKEKISEKIKSHVWITPYLPVNIWEICAFPCREQFWKTRRLSIDCLVNYCTPFPCCYIQNFSCFCFLVHITKDDFCFLILELFSFCIFSLSSANFLFELFSGFCSFILLILGPPSLLSSSSELYGSSLSLTSSSL